MNAQYTGELIFLQNNFYAYEDYALVGTKGHCFEGPFYLDRRGRILGWDEKKEEQSIKLVEREIERLIRSFEDARAAGFRKYLMFLHYPPTNILEDDSPFTKIAEEYGAEQVIYAGREERYFIQSGLRRLSEMEAEENPVKLSEQND